jgi:hypothetical protein
LGERLASRHRYLLPAGPPVLRRPVETTDNSGQRWILARAGLSAFDPTATLAVRCGNGFDADFNPYQSTRLSR